MSESTNLRAPTTGSDVLNVPVAALDAEGIVEQANDAWQNYVAGDGAVALARCGIGDNFLDFCRSGQTRWQSSVRCGVDEVLRGRRTGFRHGLPARADSIRSGM